MLAQGLRLWHVYREQSKWILNSVTVVWMRVFKGAILRCTDILMNNWYHIYHYKTMICQSRVFRIANSMQMTLQRSPWSWKELLNMHVWRWNPKPGKYTLTPQLIIEVICELCLYRYACQYVANLLCTVIFDAYICPLRACLLTGGGVTRGAGVQTRSGRVTARPGEAVDVVSEGSSELLRPRWLPLLL